MTSIMIFIGSGPYTTERPYTALRFAYSALIEGHTVKMFAFEDAIFALRNNQNPSDIYNLQEWVARCFEEPGFEIASCGVCMKARGMAQKEVIEGVKMGTMEMAVAWTVECEKQLFF
jgi:sulfur relay (sulfurtransferase) complex TusBCD TusD component (DsrE family)